MTDLHTLIDRLGDRCPEDLRFYVETGHKAAFVVDVRRYAGRALAAICRVVREQDAMLRLACADLARDSKEWHEERGSTGAWTAEQFIESYRRRVQEADNGR